MNNISVRNGLTWIKQGFFILRKQPTELTGLFLLYMILMLLIGAIPILGQILPMMLIPAITLVFFNACKQIEAGKKVLPSLLFAVVRHPAFKKLLVLGTLYILVALIVLALASLVDGGVMIKIITGRVALDSKEVQGAHLGFPLFVAGLVSVPPLMAFWFAMPLIALQEMGIGKALFYSFFAVKRSLSAFVAFAAGWFVVGILLPATISAILLILTHQMIVAMVVILPLSAICSVALYCSIYASYKEVFSEPNNTEPLGKR